MPAIPSDLNAFRAWKAKQPKPQFGPPDCEHKQEWLECGFGLAGGGYGPYEYCTMCYRVLNKVQIEE
jgi:hypothetical protein